MSVKDGAKLGNGERLEIAHQAAAEEVARCQKRLSDAAWRIHESGTYVEFDSALRDFEMWQKDLAFAKGRLETLTLATNLNLVRWHEIKSR